MSSLLEKAKALFVSDTPEVAEAKRLLNAYHKEVSNDWNARPANFETGRTILAAPPDIQALIVILIYEKDSSRQRWDWSLNNLLNQLQARRLAFTESAMERYLEAVRRSVLFAQSETPLKKLRQYLDDGRPLTGKMQETLFAMRHSLHQPFGAARRFKLALEELLGVNDIDLPNQGDAWADAFFADFAAMAPDKQALWKPVLRHAQTENGGKPTGAWKKTARQHIAALGEEDFAASLARWLGKVALPGNIVHDDYGYVTSGLSDRNISVLKGFAWYASLLNSDELARAVGQMVEGCLKKIAGVGPWGVRAANAGVYALGEMPGLEAAAQLARLKTRVTYRATRSQIEKALEQAARRAGVTPEEWEDLAAPDYGLDADGTRRETFGDSTATLTLSPLSGDVYLTWEKAGKPLKSVPADVKKNHAEEWKAFKADVDGLQQTVTAQRERFEQALFPTRTWTLGAWRERCLAHPVLGSLSRRLLWKITEGERSATVLPSGPAPALLNVGGQRVEGFGAGAEVQLWYPLFAPTETVLAWRVALEARRIVQPFKQAHREIYLLTDAELATETYSNRFAGHILKQHQAHALFQQRGWRYALQGGFDGGGDQATRTIAPANLRAEFWTEAVSGREAAMSPAGIYLYISTDQVRFYQGEGRRPLPLIEVSALVFSEIMRDVDLFVGVASVGNDPTWQDGGPQGRYRDYWQDYSFGELSASAATRAEVLAKLLPRLKIADRTRIEGRFLIVRGDLRTYKIHLGSGNILMEPNDQYLCIVQNRSTDADGSLFLPFEGDQRLSLILSKAFLLAEDKKITDPTITRQIKL